MSSSQATSSTLGEYNVSQCVIMNLFTVGLYFKRILSGFFNITTRHSFRLSTVPLFHYLTHTHILRIILTSITWSRSLILPGLSTEFNLKSFTTHIRGSKCIINRIPSMALRTQCLILMCFFSICTTSIRIGYWHKNWMQRVKLSPFASNGVLPQLNINRPSLWSFLSILTSCNWIADVNRSSSSSSCLFLAGS